MTTIIHENNGNEGGQAVTGSNSLLAWLALTLLLFTVILFFLFYLIGGSPEPDPVVPDNESNDLVNPDNVGQDEEGFPTIEGPSEQSSPDQTPIE